MLDFDNLPNFDKRNITFLDIHYNKADKGETVFETLKNILLRTADIRDLLKVLVFCRANETGDFDESYFV